MSALGGLIDLWRFILITVPKQMIDKYGTVTQKQSALYPLRQTFNNPYFSEPKQNLYNSIC